MLTIITPTLNAAGTIRTLLDSVASQVPACRHIIVDGGSTDETYLIANEFPHVEWVDAPRSSIYEAQNIGLGCVDDGWVYFIGADDWLVADSSLADAVSVAEGARVINGRVDRPGLYNNSRQSPLQQAWIYRRELFSLYGQFNTSLRVYADMDFHRRLRLAGERIRRVDNILAHVSPGGFSMREKP